MLARLADGYELCPEKYKPNGFIAQRSLMMMADVGNQAVQAGINERIRVQEHKLCGVFPSKRSQKPFLSAVARVAA